MGTERLQPAAPQPTPATAIAGGRAGAAPTPGAPSADVAPIAVRNPRVRPGVIRREPTKATQVTGKQRFEAAATGGFVDVGSDFAGRWTPEVDVRERRSFSGDRTRQVMRHLSTVLYHVAVATVEREQEIESMLVEGRLLISSNLPASVDALATDPVKLAGELVRTPGPDADLADRGERSRRNLAAAIRGDRLDTLTFDDEDDRRRTQELVGILRAVADDPTNLVHTVDVKQAPAALMDDAKRGSLILVRGFSQAHAEQNLVLAFAKSGSTDTARIYGKKRPCTGCSMTMAYAREVLGKRLVYNGNPGGLWGTSWPGFWRVASLKTPPITLEQVDEFAKSLPPRTFRSAAAGRRPARSRKPAADRDDEDAGYDTESDDEGD